MDRDAGRVLDELLVVTARAGSHQAFTQIVVRWTPRLLRHAERAKQVGRNPRITEYEAMFGPSASYYAWEAAGGPVHGVRAP